jgi:outer membrane protein TolC
MRVAGCLLWAAFLGVVTMASAQEVEQTAPLSLPTPLSLSTAIGIALERNTEIRAQVLFAEAERERVLAARGEFDVRLFADSGWTDVDVPSADAPGSARRYSTGNFSAGARKRFATGTDAEIASALDYTDDTDEGVGQNPVFDSALSLLVQQDLLRDAGVDINRTPILTAEDRWAIARQGVRDVTMQTMLDVESAYWGLYFAKADLRVRQAQLERANRLVQVAESQVRVGEAAPIEITRSRSSAAAQEVAILDAQNRISLLRNRLLRLLGVLDPARIKDGLELADEPGGIRPVGTLDDSVNIAWDRRPDCRQADLLLHIADLRERFTRNQQLPSLKLYGGVGLAGRDEEAARSGRALAEADYPTWEVGVTFEIPLPNRAAVGTYRAAALERKRASTLRRAVLERAVREVADALDELRTAAQRIDSARQSRDLAQELLTAEEKSFRLGRSDSLDVLNAQAALATAEREELRARTAYATALAALYAVRGDLIEKKGVQTPR